MKFKGMDRSWTCEIQGYGQVRAKIMDKRDLRSRTGEIQENVQVRAKVWTGEIKGHGRVKLKGMDW